jgi:(p)ppGpp synthase/HD superfamily hydrolase
MPEVISSDAVGPFFGDDFTKALGYAIKVHNRQPRKGSEGKIAYAGHLLGVCSLVIEAGGNEVQAIAALLHDAAEDQGGQETLEEIRAEFGDRVAGIVRACTDSLAPEGRKEDWRLRKEAYIDELESNGDPEILLVSLADKLFNARAILRDLRRPEVGDKLWKRFKGGQLGQLWYYARLGEIFSARLPHSFMAQELAETCAELKRLTAHDDEVTELQA